MRIIKLQFKIISSSETKSRRLNKLTVFLSKNRILHRNENQRWNEIEELLKK